MKSMPPCATTTVAWPRISRRRWMNSLDRGWARRWDPPSPASRTRPACAPSSVIEQPNSRRPCASPPALTGTLPLARIASFPGETTGDSNGAQRPLSVHVGIGDRRPSGQDRRPDLRRRPGRGAPPGPDGPRGVRDAPDHGLCIIAGEITTSLLRGLSAGGAPTIEEVGYTTPTTGSTHKTCAVISAVDEQSPDIAMGVDTGGAGDQGHDVRLRVRETPELMPLPIMLAHRLTRRLAEVRRSGTMPALRPDGKSPGHASSTRTAQPAADLGGRGAAPSTPTKITMEQLRRDPYNTWSIRSCRRTCRRESRQVHVNPTGRFVVGGPQGDTGLTGRKIIVDTYGGAGHHGAAPSRARIRPRSIDRHPTWRATSPRTSSRRARRTASMSRSPTPSEWRTRCRSTWRPTGRPMSIRTSWKGPCARCSASGRARSSSTSTCAGRSHENGGLRMDITRYFLAYARSSFENAPGSKSATVVSTTSPFKFVKYTGIPASQNSAITCLHAPQGDIGPSVSPVTASALNERTPSEIALKNAVRSAQFVMLKAEFSMLQP